VATTYSAVITSSAGAHQDHASACCGAYSIAAVKRACHTSVTSIGSHAIAMIHRVGSVFCCGLPCAG
jgi:hypothetical protein